MVWEHYKVNPIGKTGLGSNGDSLTSHLTSEMQTTECTVSRIKEFFSEDKDDDTSTDELNLLFLGTSGVHGWYGDLDECEEQLKHVGEKDEWDETIYKPSITVCMVHTRVCCIQYGNIDIESQDDIDYLRRICTRSIKAILAQQFGNYDHEFRKKFDNNIKGQGVTRSWI